LIDTSDKALDKGLAFAGEFPIPNFASHPFQARLADS
jgi:hypothetical protein